MRKFLLIGLMLVLMAVPVMAEQSWDNNASFQNPVILYGNTTYIDEDYTFTYWLNGSSLNLESDCSDLFVVYQDTTEVDRVIEGDCQSAEQDALTVSWKMRAGATMNPYENSSDWSIWTDGIGGIVPSDDPALVYSFYDDFENGYNSSKWESGGGGGDLCTVTSGYFRCLQGNTRSVPTFDGNWTIISNVSYIGTGNYKKWGFWQKPYENNGGGGTGVTVSIGTTNPANPDYRTIRAGTGRFGGGTVVTWDTPESKAVRTPQEEYGLLGFTKQGNNGFKIWNSTHSYTETAITGLLPSWTNYGSPQVIKFEGGGDSGELGIYVEWVLAKTWAEYPPTLDITLEDQLIVQQLTPQEGSLNNGIDTVFNCSVLTISDIGTNVTNVTLNLYNITSGLDYSEFYDYDGLGLNQTHSSFVRNQTEDGEWSWQCIGTSTTNQTVASPTKSFTVDTGVPTMSILSPILSSNTSNIIVEYNVTDDTDVSCYWGVNIPTNTSISCSDDGLYTIVELDLSTSINYGVLNQFNFYANDSLQNNNSNSMNFTVIEMIDEQWIGNGLETESQQFNITLDDPLNIIDLAKLVYDNSWYDGSLLSTSGSQKTYGVTINQPSVDSGTETRYFNWSIEGLVDGNSGSTTYPTHSSVIGNIEIAPTTDGTTCDSVDATLYTLNFTFKNETDDAVIEGANLVAWYEVWTTSSSSRLNFTWTESHAGVSTYPVCIFPDFGEFNADIKLIYGEESEYEYREFNLQNVVINNQTQSYNLYLKELGSTTTITITVQDDVGRNLEEYLVKAILYNYGNSTTPVKEVESQITDPDGIVIMELDASDYYSFEVWKDGTLVHTRPPALLTQSEFTIVVTTQELYDSTIFTELSNGITTTLTYSNTTGNITATWNDAGALGDSYCLNVYDHSSGDNSPFNSQCDTDNNGQLIYHIGNSTEATGKWLARLDVRAVENSAYYTLEELWIDNEENWRTFGTEGLMWGGIIATTTLALLGAPAPAAVIAGTTLTLVVLGNMAEFFSFGWGVMALFILIAGVFIYFMRD